MVQIDLVRDFAALRGRMILFLMVLPALGVPAATSTARSGYCLTGYMTDVQDWVAKDGSLLRSYGDYRIDLSGMRDAEQLLRQELASTRRGQEDEAVSALSLARCGLRQVPEVFSLQDGRGRSLSSSLRHLSLYGNNFGNQLGDFSVTFSASNAVPASYDENIWERGLHIPFQALEEIDLRACGIETIRNGTFKTMHSLKALYLGENNIIKIEALAFQKLNNLIHLDLSDNEIESKSCIQIHEITFYHLATLKTLDFSNTKLKHENANIFTRLPKNLQKLSICGSEISNLSRNAFTGIPIQYLDVSCNSQLLSLENHSFLENIQNTLIVLYAEKTGMQTMAKLKGFNNLRVLKLSNNQISSAPLHVLSTLSSLQILDLASNRVPSWFGPLFKYAPSLQFLSLVRNNLNVMSDAMIADLKDISYIGLSENYFVCSCSAREFMETTIQTERRIDRPKLFVYNDKASLDYHSGFREYKEKVSNRIRTTVACETYQCTDSLYNTSYLLFDYDSQSYRCFIVEQDLRQDFMEVEKCPDKDRSLLYDNVLRDQTVALVIVSLLVFLVFGALGVVFAKRWWCVRYFCITVKNSAMLSMINNEESSHIPTTLRYHYDVFVSYCNEDRAWVLDQLLPHVELDCNISVCLHERDFQVGLSILENIVSCMDRSRSILLVLSHRFLLSQWCQFEMHLAQHRLLETRREDLILVLLEEIPRARRPNTLHYLMMTKTYIVWPQKQKEREQFWRRIRKSLARERTVREAIAGA